jgi:type IV pilus assembly protein PilC
MLTGFAVLWGVILGGWLLITAIRRQAARNVMLDRSLGLIPIIGGMRRDLALSRFSAAYDMQLEAGVNVLGALEASGRASASASLREATGRAVADVRSGEPVSTALTATRVFPERFLRAFMIGEESGRLDQELRSLSDEYRVGGLRKLEALSEWVPRMIFIAVAVMVGWKVFSFYAGYLESVQQIIRS